MDRIALRSADGTEIAAVRWTPAGEVRGDVLLVHGLAEHMGRYGHVAKALTDAGYRVLGVELRGHGHSGGKRGHVDNWERYVDDLRAAANAIGGPHAIVAHSMGGLVTLDHLRDGDAWAVFTSAPLLEAAVPAPAWKIGAAKVLTKLLPKLSMGNEIPTSWICTDPAVVAAYDADPLVYGTVTPRWYTEMLGAQGRVKGSAAAYDVPLFAAWGTGDKIVSGPAIDAFAGRWGGPKQTHAYDGLFHEILNEPVKGTILAEVVAFLDAHRPSA